MSRLTVPEREVHWRQCVVDDLCHVAFKAIREQQRSYGLRDAWQHGVYQPPVPVMPESG